MSKWVKYNTMIDALAYLPKLQAFYDSLGLSVSACVFPADDDRRPCLKLLVEGYPDVGSGEVVDTITPVQTEDL